MLSYDKYVELLSKRITAMSQPSAKVVMTEKDHGQIKEFEAAQPDKCPHCQRTVRSFQGSTIVHDIAACGKTNKDEPKKLTFDGD